MEQQRVELEMKEKKNEIRENTLMEKEYLLSKKIQESDNIIEKL